jgi:RimJ/RimL family protein N-acetyltransferase
MSINDLFLREVVPDDLPIFFEQELDPEANHMAAFTTRDPADRTAFDAHWKRILADSAVIVRTIVYGGEVAGYVLSYETAGDPEVSYWLGKPYWGRGVASAALRRFLAEVNRKRPIYGRAAKDNLASLRVMEKCGFRVIHEVEGFARARQAVITEVVLVLAEDESPASFEREGKPGE